MSGDNEPPPSDGDDKRESGDNKRESELQRRIEATVEQALVKALNPMVQW